MLNTLTTRLKHERRQRLVADDWTSLLTRELDAHISARIRAEDELQRNRQLLRQLAADLERLKQGRDRALEQQVLQQLNDSQTGRDLSGCPVTFVDHTYYGMNIVSHAHVQSCMSFMQIRMLKTINSMRNVRPHLKYSHEQNCGLT